MDAWLVFFAMLAGAIWYICNLKKVDKKYDEWKKKSGKPVSNELAFERPDNGFRETTSYPWLWTLLFGPFYFALKGIWIHAIISGVVAICTVGFSWLLYPFFSRQIVVNHYLRKGWKQVE